uniref:Uncharacterized protein n=2 Tax=Caenorhabditis japonica TaxID=281687 RepID=A0A8R1EIK4_CAEJA
MSLLSHLRLYHGDWMPKRDELNMLFANRPALSFTIYPGGHDITARPIIANTLIHYKIRNPEEYAICFDTDLLTFYPAELIYIYDIETYSHLLTNRFTIVV